MKVSRGTLRAHVGTLVLIFVTVTAAVGVGLSPAAARPATRS